MMNNLNYDDIRPYNDAETSEALKRIANAPELSKFMNFLIPGKGDDSLKNLLCSLSGVEEFQAKVMSCIIRRIIEKTSSSLTTGGIENLRNGKKHIMISNHRDIVLDPAIIQLILFDNGLSTAEIAVGDNLISNPLIRDVFRSNRMIKVVRGGTSREKYDSSILLSNYLRQSVTSGKCSVWIAQRNGRSKDGKDITEQGLIKMLNMSGSGDFVKDFMELAILPVSISYQFEPCDFLKARELFISKRRRYVKSPGEDTNSIITGVKQFKGGIDFEFLPEFTENEISDCSFYDKNERFKVLSHKIDLKINSNYRLWDNNYIAFDLLNGCEKHHDKYSEEAKINFTNYMEKGLSAIMEKDLSVDDKEELRDIFLNIYSNPVSADS